MNSLITAFARTEVPSKAGKRNRLKSELKKLNILNVNGINLSSKRPTRSCRKKARRYTINNINSAHNTNNTNNNYNEKGKKSSSKKTHVKKIRKTVIKPKQKESKRKSMCKKIQVQDTLSIGKKSNDGYKQFISQLRQNQINRTKQKRKDLMNRKRKIDLLYREYRNSVSKSPKIKKQDGFFNDINKISNYNNNKSSSRQTCLSNHLKKLKL